MPRLPGQPPGLDPLDDDTVVSLGTALEETTVAGICCLVVWSWEDVVSWAAGLVASTGMTVTVEGDDDDGCTECEAIVGSTTAVEVASGVEVGAEALEVVVSTTIGVVEDVKDVVVPSAG